MEAIVFIVVVGLCTWGGYAIGKHKGRPTAGLLLGLLLGVIGLVIIALIPKTELKKRQELADFQRMYPTYAVEPPGSAGYGHVGWTAADQTQAMRRYDPPPPPPAPAPQPPPPYAPAHQRPAAQSGFDQDEPDWTQLKG